MIIGERLKELREQKNLSQGDIEKRSGLLRCYISRVENGHTVPAVETLEKMAKAMEIPMYQLFYDGEVPPKLRNLPKHAAGEDGSWEHSESHGRIIDQFRKFLGRANEKDRKLLFFIAQKMASQRRSAAKAD